LGIGDWGLGPIPNPQSPIPNNEVYIKMSILNLKIKLIISNKTIIKINLINIKCINILAT